MTRKYILAAINICISIFLSALFVIGTLKIGILEHKIIYFLSFLFILFTATFIYAYFSKKNTIYNVGVFLSFLFNIILLYNIYDLNIRYDYIKDIFNNDSKYVTYNVYVQRKTTIYDQINKLDGHKIGILENNFNTISKNLSQETNIEFIAYTDIEKIENAILNGEIQGFALTEDDLSKKDLEATTIMKKVRVIYTDKYKDSL